MKIRTILGVPKNQGYRDPDSLSDLHYGYAVPGVAHNPSGYAIVFSIRTIESESDACQFAIDSNNKFYTRFRNGKNWSAWSEK